MDRKHAYPGNRVICLLPGPHREKLVSIVEAIFPPGTGMIKARVVNDEEPNRGEVVEGGLDDFKPRPETLLPKRDLSLNGS